MPTTRTGRTAVTSSWNTDRQMQSQDVFLAWGDATDEILARWDTTDDLLLVSLVSNGNDIVRTGRTTI